MSLRIACAISTVFYHVQNWQTFSSMIDFKLAHTCTSEDTSRRPYFYTVIILWAFFFLSFCRTWTKRYLITSQTRVKHISRIHHRTIIKISKKKDFSGWRPAHNRLSLSLPLSFSSSSYFLSFSKQKMNTLSSQSVRLTAHWDDRYADLLQK